MKTCLRFGSMNAIDVKGTFIVVTLGIVLQLCALSGETQTTYWLESMSNTVKKESVATPPVIASDATVLSYANIPLFIFEDERNGYVYWCDAGTGSIRKVSTSGGAVITVVTGITGAGIYPRGIYVDVTNNKLYWGETAPKVKDVIKKIDISGSLPKDAALGTKVVTGIDIVRGLTVDTVAKLVYFADAGKRGSGKGIYRASTTGPTTEATSTKVCSTSATSQPNSLFIDRTHNFIYWSDYAAAGKIQRAATDASTFPTTAKNVYTGASIRSMSIDLTANEIYWTEYPSLKIRKASLSTIPVINSTDVVTGLSVLPRNLQFTPLACGIPTGLSTTNISSTAATLNWSSVTGATKYTVQYRVSGTTTWVTKKTTSLSINLTGLTPSTIYKWKVRTMCTGDSSAYSAVQTFTTAAAFTAKNGATKQQLSLSNLRLYPNPARHIFMIELSLNESVSRKAEIQLISAQGSAGYKAEAQVYNGQLKKQVTTSTAIVPGIYLVRITIADEVFVGKLIIER